MMNMKKSFLFTFIILFVAMNGQILAMNNNVTNTEEMQEDYIELTTLLADWRGEKSWWRGKNDASYQGVEGRQLMNECKELEKKLLPLYDECKKTKKCKKFNETYAQLKKSIVEMNQVTQTKEYKRMMELVSK